MQFSIGDKVWCRLTGKNAVVERYKTETTVGGTCSYCYICYWGLEGVPVYDWMDCYFLEPGHKIE